MLCVQGILMRKLTLASMILAAVATTTTVYAADAQKTVTQQSLQERIQKGKSLEGALTAALKSTPENAEAIIATAIAIAGDDENLIKRVLTAAVNAGVPADTVTAIAIANNVDATIASEATAAGAAPGSNNGSSVKATPAPPSAGGGGGNDGISEN